MDCIEFFSSKLKKKIKQFVTRDCSVLGSGSSSREGSCWLPLSSRPFLGVLMIFSQFTNEMLQIRCLRKKFEETMTKRSS